MPTSRTLLMNLKDRLKSTIAALQKPAISIGFTQPYVYEIKRSFYSHRLNFLTTPARQYDRGKIFAPLQFLPNEKQYAFTSLH